MVVALVATSVVVLLALAVEHAWSPLIRLDAAIEEAVHPWAVRTPWAVDVSRFLETIGRFRVSFWVATATVLVLLVLRRWRLALGVALGYAIHLVNDAALADFSRAMRTLQGDPDALIAGRDSSSGVPLASINEIANTLRRMFRQRSEIEVSLSKCVNFFSRCRTDFCRRRNTLRTQEVGE